MCRLFVCRVSEQMWMVERMKRLRSEFTYMRITKPRTTTTTGTSSNNNRNDRMNTGKKGTLKTYQMNSLTHNKNSNSYVIYFSNHIMFVSMVYLVLFGRRHLLWLWISVHFVCPLCARVLFSLHFSYILLALSARARFVSVCIFWHIGNVRFNNFLNNCCWRYRSHRSFALLFSHSLTLFCHPFTDFALKCRIFLCLFLSLSR